MNTNLKFSFQGVNGAYSELAGIDLYPNYNSIPCKTFEEMFEKVRDQEAEIAIVPIENSRAGRVGDTQRLIPDSKLKMVSELNQKEDAAIASELAAKTYSLDILQNNFQDSEKNVTRFLIMSNNLNTPDSNDDDLMTTLVFELKSIPAALYKALGGLASNGVNMTKLESYINPQGFDVAQFYTDIEGHPENQKVKLALEEMKYYCKHVNILGVYKMSNFRKK